MGHGLPGEPFADSTVRCGKEPNHEDELLSTLIRMMVGVTGQSTATCEWYESIEWDAVTEAEDIISRLEVNV